MGTQRHLLKNLRAIALEHARSAHPDLASMARELGRVVHQDAPTMAMRLESLRKRQRGFERFLLGRRNKPPISVWVMAWPPNHASPLHGLAGAWGLEMALVGALEVQSSQRDRESGGLILTNRHWLGPGDGTWFEGDPNQLRRCRNLSRQEIALSLHVYGNELADHAAHEQREAAGQRMATPPRNSIAGRLHG